MKMGSLVNPADVPDKIKSFCGNFPIFKINEVPKKAENGKMLRCVIYQIIRFINQTSFRGKKAAKGPGRRLMLGQFVQLT